MAWEKRTTERSGRVDRRAPPTGQRARRRGVAIAVLFDRQRPTPVDELATAVADVGASRGIFGESVRTDRVRVALHHVDLPELDDVGIVDFDLDRNVATLALDRLQRHR